MFDHIVLCTRQEILTTNHDVNTSIKNIKYSIASMQGTWQSKGIKNLSCSKMLKKCKQFNKPPNSTIEQHKQY